VSESDKFSLIARAYEILSDPTERKMYDMLNKKNTHENKVGLFLFQNPVLKFPVCRNQ